MKRSCMDCEYEIKVCNGFVVAGDFMLALDGKLDFEKVRERCGRCILAHSVTPEEIAEITSIRSVQ